MKKICTIVWIILFSLATVGLISTACADDGKGNIIVVSMGDSYSSGEGIEPFYGQYNSEKEKTKDPDWLAHRSMLSWPGKLVFPEFGVPLKDVPRGFYSFGDFTPGNWYFVASSGALTENLTMSQKKEYRRRLTSGVISSRKSVQLVEAQCNVLRALRDRGMYADYITLTLGGNDVDFPKIIASAVIGGDQMGLAYTLPATLEATWQKFYEGGIKEKIRQAYKTIWNANGKQGMILVAGYPRLLDENGGGLPFSKDEAKRINEAVSQFNDELEQLVNECRNEDINIWFISVEEEFWGKGAYAKNEQGRDIALINPLILKIQAEDLDLRAWFSAYSIHPNADGAAAYARSVQKFIDGSLPYLKKTTEKTESNTVSVGQSVSLGHYEQDSNIMNGKEPIEWIILKQHSDGGLVLMSKNALSFKAYHGESKGVAWENCTLRKWLNEDFYNAAFSTEEKKKIQTVHLLNENNPSYSTKGGNSTYDKVWLLSINEVCDYYTNSKLYPYFINYISRLCLPANYAVNRGSHQKSVYNLEGMNVCRWWLRSSGSTLGKASYVDYDGYVDSQGYYVSSTEIGVRPVIVIKP